MTGYSRGPYYPQRQHPDSRYRPYFDEPRGFYAGAKKMRDVGLNEEIEDRRPRRGPRE